MFKTAVTFKSTADVAPLALNLEGNKTQNLSMFWAFRAEKRISMRTGMQTREEKRFFFSPIHLFPGVRTSAAVPIAIHKVTVYLMKNAPDTEEQYSNIN